MFNTVLNFPKEIIIYRFFMMTLTALLLCLGVIAGLIYDSDKIISMSLTIPLYMVCIMTIFEENGAKFFRDRLPKEELDVDKIAKLFKSKFSVDACHPIARRVLKLDLTFQETVNLHQELEELGYEDIIIKEMT